MVRSRTKDHAKINHDPDWWGFGRKMKKPDAAEVREIERAAREYELGLMRSADTDKSWSYLAHDADWWASRL